MLQTIIALAKSEVFHRVLTPLIKRILARYTTLELRDYADLLNLREDYRIIELKIRRNSWLHDKSIQEANLSAEGVTILGVKRSNKSFIGAPPNDFVLEAGDLLILYGRRHRLDELSSRLSGDNEAHISAKFEHDIELDEQQKDIEGD